MLGLLQTMRIERHQQAQSQSQALADFRQDLADSTASFLSDLADQRIAKAKEQAVLLSDFRKALFTSIFGG